MRKLRYGAACLALSVSSLTSAQQAGPPKPPRPPETVPSLREVKSVIVCGDCDKPFDTSTHKQVMDGLLSNKYIGELRKALYWQDSAHQFESKAHYDNCDFDGATSYVDSLLAEIDGHVIAAKAAKEKGDGAAAEARVVKAFFALGQALHGVQDFYAHTNYVEMSVGAAKKSTDIEVVMPWKRSGKDRIKELVGNGLVSGFVVWGLPQHCAKGVASHEDMAKDKETTTSGKVRVAHLQNRSRYQIAAQLAREASQELVDDAFRRWPLLKEINGQHVAFEVLVDRRGL
ncbi:HET-C-related protein [Ramlibacter sp. WS9]|uniref:HET-C-related protein n=1 Tax=Ramlibacter sp. WS9 TaxID=1882741 RepID=UPI0013051911|nr:HET-C-related protein [Ramlibacter sp. WS9]